MKAVKVVYTVSDKGSMISDVLQSLNSVRKFFNREDVTVFYTPPCSEENFLKLRRLAIVKKVPNLTKPFTVFPSKGQSYYGEKIHLCDVDDPNVIFLDADTIVKKDLLPLLVGNYDFSARIGSGYFKMNLEIWRATFKKYGKRSIPMPNTGFMIFKNYTHKKIREEWLKFLNIPLANPLPKSYLKEQYALALALSGKKIKWMSQREQAFRWEGEFGWRSIVVHGSPNPLLQKLRLFARKILEWQGYTKIYQKQRERMRKRRTTD